LSEINKNNADKVQPEKDEDFELIRKFQNGDDSAFTKLVLKHKEKVRNLIYLTLGDVDYIDDISQDVFISAFKMLGDFRYESKFTTWLYRVTVNKCKDYLRKKKVRSIFAPIDEHEYHLRAKSRSDNPDVSSLVRKAIAKLPDKLREPLVLRDIDGLSYKEIADKFNCEVGTIKSRIFRARQALRIILEPFQKDLL